MRTRRACTRWRGAIRDRTRWALSCGRVRSGRSPRQSPVVPNSSAGPVAALPLPLLLQV
ncbi:uncharacterized protein ACA1_057780, partial [Acanthamoeba castellanii str. Neff]